MSTFKKQRIAYFQDTDAAGIVYFSQFFNFAHEALEEHLMAQGISIASVIAEGTNLWPITRSECLYRSPVRLHDVLEVSGEVRANGESSMVTSCTVFNKTTAREAALVTIEHTFISAIDWKKVAIPEDAKRLLLPTPVSGE